MTSSANKTPVEANAAMVGCGSAEVVATARPARHRLGPLVSLVRLERPVVSRLYAAGLATAAGGLLIIAASLIPSGRHLGTHRQLGLPPCGFAMMTGLPCPTCGMTTAFAHAVRGQFIEAIRSQPAGFLLALATAGFGLVAALATVTGRRPAVNWYRVNPMRLLWWSVGLLVASWAAKIVLGLVDGSLPAR